MSEGLLLCVKGVYIVSETKKTTARSKTSSVKKVSKPVEKASEVKAEVEAVPVETAEKEAVKKTRKTAAGTTETTKAPAKKAAKAEVKKEVKAQVKEAVHVEFSGKSYTSEDLIKICRDVWKYDLNGKDEDIKSIELYVKPEESVTYYVINGDVQGSFNI